MVGHDLGYLPIHDIPSHDDATLLNPDEQSQLASELTAARDRNELLGKFEKPKPMKAAVISPSPREYQPEERGDR